MAQIIDIQRKSAVLKHPALPCLSSYHTINLMSGCPYNCRYCYTQSFRSYPGKGKLLFYSNTYDLLQKELERKRKKPELVYLSTACEPFVPFQRVLSTLYTTMKLLLENSIFLLISTKSLIPEYFIELFSRYPDMVHVQVGLTTSDDKIRKAVEPDAPSVGNRLEALRRLSRMGLQVEVRMDPLIPELTDTEESFNKLCEQTGKCEVNKAVASYLFIRRGIYKSMDINIGDWSFDEIRSRFYTHKIERYCGHGTINAVAPDIRKNKYAMMKRIAYDNGIALGLCKCKNPDITVESCHPNPKRISNKAHQQNLF